MEDIYKYAQYCFKMVYEKEKDKELKKSFENLNTFNKKSSYRFLLKLYGDYENSENDKDINISRNNFVEIIKILESYLMRRIICDRSNSITDVFLKLNKNIDRKDYVNYFIANLLRYQSNDSYYFPSNEELKNSYEENIPQLSKHYKKYIQKRTDISIEDISNEKEALYEKLIKIWEHPYDNSNYDKEKINGIIRKLRNKDGIVDGIDSYDNLRKGTQLRNVFDELDIQIMNLNTDEKDIIIIKDFFKKHFAYNVNKNTFIRMVALRNKIKIHLEIEIEDLDDPLGLCEKIESKNVTPKGKTRLYLKNMDEIHDVIEIIKQAYYNTEI